MILNSSNTDSPKAPLSRNVTTTSDEGLLYVKDTVILFEKEVTYGYGGRFWGQMASASETILVKHTNVRCTIKSTKLKMSLNRCNVSVEESPWTFEPREDLDRYSGECRGPHQSPSLHVSNTLGLISLSAFISLGRKWECAARETSS
jgi:hypothetical protein